MVGVVIGKLERHGKTIRGLNNINNLYKKLK